MHIDEFLDAVRKERKRAALSGGTSTSWPFLFKTFFVDSDEHADDLIFFVASNIGPAAARRKPEDILEVFRRGSTTRPLPPISGRTYNWEQSACLNLLMQQVTYELTSAICRRDPDTLKLRILEKRTIPVFPSPSKRSLEVKMSDEQITFPFLYFTIDNFDELFEGMVVTQGHDACVELVAECGSIRTTVFSGSVTHGQLMASFLSRKSGRKYQSKRTKQERKMEFLNMRGPSGIGHAEMAVSRKEGDIGAKDGAVSGFLRKLGINTSGVLNDRESKSFELNSFLTSVTISLAPPHPTFPICTTCVRTHHHQLQLTPQSPLWSQLRLAELEHHHGSVD
eukprot:m.65471 g.65471  ORF g.65471 m.65471 type:complete len:338 (+) comp17985_c0_seq1:231-1244(+)